MIQRINSLGRKRIPQSCVEIVVEDGDPRTFTAEIELEPGENDWPAQAAVVMEATSAGSSTVERFSCGTVGQLQTPRREPLVQTRGQNVFFSLKIIDQSERIGRLLGVAENLRPDKAGEQTETGRRGILPVERKVLGQQLWRLEFGEHHVALVVNRDVPDLSERVGSDPVFYALIYPEVIRQVLTRAIFEAGDPDADDDRWPTLWLCFGRKLHPTHQDPPRYDEREEIDEWVEEVVAAFCDQHSLRERYTASGYANGD